MACARMRGSTADCADYAETCAAMRAGGQSAPFLTVIAAIAGRGGSETRSYKSKNIVNRPPTFIPAGSPDVTRRGCEATRGSFRLSHEKSVMRSEQDLSRLRRSDV